MKKIITLVLSLCIGALVFGRNSSEPMLLPIENSYIEQAMEAQNVVYSSYLDKDYLLTSFIMENKSNFKSSDLLMAKQRLESLSAKELLILNDMEFKDPVISIALSVILGGFGADRFYIGDIGLGVVKLLTGGGLGIWWLVDMFVISGKTKKNNAKDLNEALMLQEFINNK